VVIRGGMKLERVEEDRLDKDIVWEPFARDGALVSATTKRTSQRLFRDHPKARFLVSTEAGGEGINLQFCHICVNYDLPWNPMRVEQRVGRVYRYGQDKVVQVYHFFSQGTIEDKVQEYFETRLKHAAEAISQVTGEDPEDIKATLNGQLEEEINPTEIYRRAFVEGDLNKHTQKELAEAVQRAKRAYEIATQSLFRDVSSYSFDNYRKELASELTLADLSRFAERFLAKHRRQVQQRDSFLEFLVPDALKQFGLPERYKNATFNRQLAIKRGDAEFLALGHPFVDVMLSYAGSYDFGGLASIRHIQSPKLAGRSGYLFIFVARQRITRDGGDECLFQFQPVFVNRDGVIDDESLETAVTAMAIEADTTKCTPPDPIDAFETARTRLESKLALWDWIDDVEFLGMSWVEFR
jgi:hypothetical protein